jgi:hypothetical protein
MFSKFSLNINPAGNRRQPAKKHRSCFHSIYAVSPPCSSHSSTMVKTTIPWYQLGYKSDIILSESILEEAFFIAECIDVDR